MELQKREDEMRQMFVQRVKEKESELKEAEREVRRQHSRCSLAAYILCRGACWHWGGEKCFLIVLISYIDVMNLFINI